MGKSPFYFPDLPAAATEAADAERAEYAKGTERESKPTAYPERAKNAERAEYAERAKGSPPRCRRKSRHDEYDEGGHCCHQFLKHTTQPPPYI